MAEKRAITIWVNGKEVKNDIKSINTEYLNLVKSQRNMIRGSEEYLAAGRKIKELKTMIDQHNQQLRETKSMWDKVKTAAGPFLAIAAVVMAVKQAFTALVTVNTQFEKSLSSLGALTGATGLELEYYADAARQIGRSSTVGAAEAVKAMELIGSAKPDLLKNKDALIAVTKEAVALAEAAGMDLPAAADSLTKVMNQLGLDSSQASRTINVLAAGAKEGAVAIPGIADAMVQFGAVAKTSNVSLEDSVTLIELLGEKGISGAEAGTKLRNVLITLAAGPKETNPQIVGLTKALDNLKAKGLDTTAMTAMFGKENMVAAQILVSSADKVTGFTKAITGTREAYIQQAKQTDNLSSSWSRFKNKLEGLILSFNDGNGLTGAIKNVIDFGGKMVGTFTKWISIPIEDKLRKEQQEVNSLAMELTDANTPTERRKKLLEELEKISPTIVKGLDAETLNYAQLAKNIEEYNNQLTNRIILSNLQEEEESNLAALASQRLTTANLQVKLQDKLVQANKEIALGEGDSETKRQRIIKLLQDEVAQQQKNNEAGRIYGTQFAGAVDSRTKEKKLLEEILFISTNLNQQQGFLNEKQSSAVDYQKRIQSLKEILGLNSEISEATPGADPNAADPSSKNDEYLKKEQELAKKLAELRFSLEQMARDSWLREIFEANKKYNELEKEASGHAARLKEIEELKGIEINAINSKYAKAGAADVIKTGDELYDKVLSDMQKSQEETDKWFNDSMPDVHEAIMKNAEEMANAPLIAWKERLEVLKQQIDEVQQLVGALGGLQSAYNEYQNQQDEASLNSFKKQNADKRATLEKRLKAGLVSEASATRQKEQLDAELAAKEDAFAVKKAQRERKLKAFEIVVNTASAVAEALPNVPLSIIVGAMGAVQLATVLSAPAYKDGGEVTKDSLIRAGEAGREVILSNKTLTDPATGPISEWLFQKQKGMNPVFPSGSIVSPQTSARGIGSGGGSGQRSATQANVTAVVPGMDALASEMREIKQFLSDPKNRQAYITNDMLKKYKDEEAKRTSLQKIA